MLMISRSRRGELPARFKRPCNLPMRPSGGQRLFSDPRNSYLAYMQRVETETAVIGAGIIGMAIALELAEAGQVVHVVERAPSWGAEASGAAAGMLAPQHETGEAGPFLDLCLAARDLWIEKARALHNATGIDPGHRTDGLLYLAFDEAEWRVYRERAAWQVERGLSVDMLTADEIAGRFPMVSPSIAGALFYNGDHQVHTSRALEAYAAACRAAGVHFIFGEEVRELMVEQRADGARIAGVHTTGLHVTARRTVLATGAWTGRLTAALGSPLPIEPVRGQLAVASIEEGLPPCLVGSSEGYLVPRDGTEILVGATSEHVGFDRSTTGEGIASVWEAAVRMLPALAGERPSQRWAGLRPGSPDSLPIVGPLPGVSDLWIASAHYRNGILLAPVTGRIVARWIETGEPGIDPAPFLPDRFLF